MIEGLKLILAVLASLFKSRAELEAENLILRQQINVLRRRMPKRPALTNIDRLAFVWLYRWFPSTVGALVIVRPETVIRWHRLGFRAYWRWRSGDRVGRPKVSAELRALIGEMSQANPLWGAPRIHGARSRRASRQQRHPKSGRGLRPAAMGEADASGHWHLLSHRHWPELADDLLVMPDGNQ